jgi:hypothetical protein
MHAAPAPRGTRYVGQAKKLTETRQETDRDGNVRVFECLADKVAPGPGDVRVLLESFNNCAKAVCSSSPRLLAEDHLRTWSGATHAHAGRETYHELALAVQIALANAGERVVARAERRAVHVRREEADGREHAPCAAGAGRTRWPPRHIPVAGPRRQRRASGDERVRTSDAAVAVREQHQQVDRERRVLVV